MTNKKTKNTTTVKLVDSVLNKDIGLVNLTATEKHLYDKIIGHNKDAKSINSDISDLLSKGKKGKQSIERIAKVLKDNKEPLNAYKQAVHRFYKNQPKESRLSLQGLGKKGTPFIGIPSNSGGSDKNKEKDKEKDKEIITTSLKSVNAFIDKMQTADKTDFIYDLTDTLSDKDKQYLINHLTNELKKVVKKPVKKVVKKVA
jgi:hypothetical protein